MIFPAGDSSVWPGVLSGELKKNINTADALVVGPGLGRTLESEKFLETILELSPTCPIVYDADALVILARHREWLARVKTADVFTPHPGEAASLLGIKSADIQANRLEALEKLQNLAPAVIVLKGANTLVGQKDRPIFICPYDLCQMAIAGAGDILSGCIASLLGSKLYKGWPSIQLAALGVTMHALAGRSLADKYSFRGALASDLIKYLPFVREKYNSPPTGNVAGKILPWPELL